jgi:hypothetical protein
MSSSRALPVEKWGAYYAEGEEAYPSHAGVEGEAEDAVVGGVKLGWSGKVSA